MAEPVPKRVIAVDQTALDSVNGDGGSSSWSTTSSSTASASLTPTPTAALPLSSVHSTRLGTPMPKMGKQDMTLFQEDVTDDRSLRWRPVHSLSQQLTPTGSYIKFQYVVADTRDGSMAEMVPVALVVQEFTEEGVRGKVIHEDGGKVCVEHRYFEFMKIRNPCIANL